MPVRRPLLAVCGTALAMLAALTGCSATASTQAAPAPACPAGTTPHGGACIENALRPAPLSWRDSNQLCLGEGRRLPALHELQTFRPSGGGGRNAPEWHNLRYRAGTEELAGLVAGNGTVSVAPAAEPRVYRCVAAAG